jgi:hypothetical protein
MPFWPYNASVATCAIRGVICSLRVASRRSRAETNGEKRVTRVTRIDAM